MYSYIRTQSPGSLQLFVGGRRDDHSCSEGLGDLESEDGNAAGSEREHGLAGPYRTLRDEGAPRGKGRDGKAGGFLVTPTGRGVTNRRLGQDYLLLTHSGAWPSERGPRILAPEAAVLPAYDRMGDDPISGGKGSDSLGDLENHPRPVAHRNLGQGKARVVEPFQDQQVPVVQRSGVESHDNLARARLVGAVLLDLEVFGAKPMEHPALHPGSVPSRGVLRTCFRPGEIRVARVPEAKENTGSNAV